MASVDDIHNTQKSIEAILLQKMSQFEANLKAASHTTTVTQLSEDFQLFKETTWSILKLVRQQIAELSRTFDVAEMRHRKKYLLFYGIPEESSENLEKISRIMCSMLKEKLSIAEVSSSSFKACHRLGKHADGSTRPILVRFTDLSLRSTIWRKKAAFKGSSVVVAEFLTRPRQALFQSARKQLGVTNCWTLDGNIYAKLPNGTLCRLDTEEDLSNATKQVSKTPGISSVTAKTVTSDVSSGRTKRIIKNK